MTSTCALPSASHGSSDGEQRLSSYLYDTLQTLLESDVDLSASTLVTPTAARVCGYECLRQLMGWLTHSLSVGVRCSVTD